MKAYVLHGIGDLRYEDVPEPDCPPGWAVVEVKAAGICSSDIPRIYRKGTYHFPTIPGHEFSGVVTAAGDAAGRSLIGRRVSVFPLIPCRSCAQCAAGRYEMCEQYDYVGSRRDGAFAERVAVPVWNLMELPETVSFPAGALMEPFAVALHAVKRAGDLSGRSVAVMGTGAIGFAAAAWAAKRGARRATVVGRNEEKHALAERLPGVSYCNTAAEQPGESDVVIEAVGTPETAARAITLAAPGGTVVLMGNPSGEMRLSQDEYWRILRRQLTVTGTWNSSYDGEKPSDWTETLLAAADGSLDPEALITHRFAQEELSEGLRLMAERRAPYGKVMTLWNA